MKNATILTFYIIWAILLMGCEVSTEPDGPPKPFNDVSQHTLYHTGTIVDICYYTEGTQTWFVNVQYDFDDGSVIRMDLVKSDHLPKIGEHGSLYVENRYKDWNGSYIQNGNYLWIKDGTELAELIKKRIEDEGGISFEFEMAPAPSVEEVRIFKTPKKYNWRDVFNPPPVYQLVLIKLDNGIITTGRFTDENEWKIEIDRKRNKFNKYQSFKVAEWKEFDHD